MISQVGSWYTWSSSGFYLHCLIYPVILLVTPMEYKPVRMHYKYHSYMTQTRKASVTDCSSGFLCSTRRLFYLSISQKKYIIQYYLLPWVTTTELWFGTWIRKCQAEREYCLYLAVRQLLLAYHTVLLSVTQVLWKEWREIRKKSINQIEPNQTRKFKQLKLFILQRRFRVIVSKCQ